MMTWVSKMVFSQRISLTDVLEHQDNIASSREIFIDRQRMVAVNFKYEQERALALFHQLPLDFLPQLPKGYQWVKAAGRYGIMRHQYAVEHDLVFFIYGPDKKGLINFLCRCDQVTFYSFAHTQQKGFPAQRDYPLKSQDYKVVAYDYRAARFNNHIRGHMIDHHDTIATAWNSSKDIENYSPEPPDYEWGMGIRRLATHHLRSLKHGGAYAQYNHYGVAPSQTVNGTPVPEQVRFFTYQLLSSVHLNTRKKPMYQQLDFFHVSFSENLKKTSAGKILDHARQHFSADWASAPSISAYKPELTDIELRHRAQSMIDQALQVFDGHTASRFVDNDHYDLLCVAGDVEFEQCSQRLSAGIASHEQGYPHHAYNYCKSALDYAEALIQLDLAEPSLILDQNIKTHAHSFFKQADNSPMLEFADHFKQLCANLGVD